MTAPTSAAEAGRRALALARDLGRPIDGGDLRDAGISATAIGGAWVLLDLERRGALGRCKGGWRLAAAGAAPTLPVTPADRTTAAPGAAAEAP
jgi:hypothetical protein